MGDNEPTPFEKQMWLLKHKKDLHDWIDTLPEDALGIVIASYDEGDVDRFQYREIGNCTVAHLLYLLETYKHRLLRESLSD